MKMSRQGPLYHSTSAKVSGNVHLLPALITFIVDVRICQTQTERFPFGINVTIVSLWKTKRTLMHIVSNVQKIIYFCIVCRRNVITFRMKRFKIDVFPEGFLLRIFSSLFLFHSLLFQSEKCPGKNTLCTYADTPCSTSANIRWSQRGLIKKLAGNFTFVCSGVSEYKLGWRWAGFDTNVTC